LKCDLLLYDVTSTYFEGDLENCEIAKRGYSRDSRGDRPQVCIGLVVTEEGFPLGYEFFAGNMHDSLTMKSVVESLEPSQAGEPQRTSGDGALAPPTHATGSVAAERCDDAAATIHSLPAFPSLALRAS
jgi:hypothetical protein